MDYNGKKITGLFHPIINPYPFRGGSVKASLIALSYTYSYTEDVQYNQFDSGNDRVMRNFM